MHIFDPRFAPSRHWKRQPPVAPVANYRHLQARLGTQRAVVVTPSTYGTDNRCTLDALAQLGSAARGVAVVDDQADKSTLLHLAAGGICGLRVNFVTPQSWGTTTAAMLETLAARSVALGWHVQVFLHPQQLVELEPVLARLPLPLVIDHLGRIDPAQGPEAPAFDVLARLLDGGNTWVKLSGAYMRSAAGGPAYADTLALGRALVRRWPQRLVWGSDWPHTTQPPLTVDDAALLDLLDAWCEGSSQALHAVLVTNPERLYGFAGAGATAAE